MAARKEPALEKPALEKPALEKAYEQNTEMTRLTERFLNQMGNLPDTFTCGFAADLLNVTYRRLIDILHVLEGVGLLIKYQRRFKFNTKRFEFPIYERNTLVYQSNVTYQSMCTHPRVFSINNFAKRLNIPKRRMQDIVYVLKAIGAVETAGHKFYKPLTHSKSNLYWKYVLDNIWSDATKGQVDKIADTPKITDDKRPACKICTRIPDLVLSVDELASILQTCQVNGISAIVWIFDSKLLCVLKASKFDKTSGITWIVDNKLTCSVEACENAEKPICVFQGSRIDNTADIVWITDPDIKCPCDLQSLCITNDQVVSGCCPLHISVVATKDSTTTPVDTVAALIDPYTSSMWCSNVKEETNAALSDPCKFEGGCCDFGHFANETVAALSDPCNFEGGCCDFGHFADETVAALSGPY